MAGGSGCSLVPHGALMFATIAIVLLASFSSGEPQLHRQQRSANSATSAVEGLISRILGQSFVPKFSLSIIAPDPSTGNDVFEISSSPSDTLIHLGGSSGSALGAAFNWYLKYYCNASITWGVDKTGQQLRIPQPLPGVPKKMRMSSPVKYRYYMNVCTVSYSAAWWDWDRWEKEIDWMALQGINLPLSFTGQEYIWDQVYMGELGLTREEMDVHFAGPAFLAWGRMGNIRGWGGPLPADWKLRQYQLQKKILQRQREFGMKAVLPGFAGHVPAGLTRVFPQANITRSADWNNFPEEYSFDYLLQPRDPLFLKIGKLFIEKITEEFGTDHIYNADTFNEMDPSSNSSVFLAETSAAVYNGMKAGDEDALWLMQGWLFQNTNSKDKFWTEQAIKDYLSGVSNSKMLILDLWSESHPIWSETSSYFGKSFVWCMLHNFGGNRGIYGNLTRIATGPIDALATPGNTMVGTGMTPEAIEQNPVMYEMMSEMGWRADHFDVEQWVSDYATRRYGAYNAYTTAAWTTMLESVYGDAVFTKSLIVMRPPNFNRGHSTEPNTTKLVQAWRLLIKAADTLVPVGPYYYDVVDITRQVLSNLFLDLYQEYESAQESKNLEELQRLSSAMRELIKDLDKVLATDTNFLLGHWIETAKSWAQDESEEPFYEFNARNQLTLWGPTGQILDYASKQWGGLVSSFYLPRWELYFRTVESAVANHVAFNDTAYNAVALKNELAWNYNNQTFPVTPQGNPVHAANYILAKYATLDSSYTVHLNTDVPGHDILAGGTWTKDIAELSFLCNANPTCKGFNSNGYLKTATAPTAHAQGCTLYMKTA